MIRESEDRSQDDDDVSEETATVMSVPAGGGGKSTTPRTAISLEDYGPRKSSRRRREREYEIESVSTAEEDDSPAERLFGKERANELRKRITKSKKVSPQAAREALDAATAAMLGSDSTETIEFVTWFSVWILIIFWLLFYSSYGPTLWRFLYGPMGLVLVLPFGFGLLFWLVTYVFTEEED
mmetsp:Transcript_47623/g.149275  ORF Transcript_47623/g.149275 Transcript_47623/m.149275 type:complete len:182 (-) Transcript_47623:767-1312(-)